MASMDETYFRPQIEERRRRLSTLVATSLMVVQRRPWRPPAGYVPGGEAAGVQSRRHTSCAVTHPRAPEES